MQAVRIHSFGGPEVLSVEEAPVPAPREGEVLVRVAAAAMNPVDRKIREGLRAGAFGHDFPMTLGFDVSGVVEGVGESAGEFGPGDEVLGMLELDRPGACAQYVCASAGVLVRKPDYLEHLSAASIPLAGLTAWQALFDHGKLRADQRVLVHAAAGCVGGFAVQFARAAGARVTAVARGRDCDRLLHFGAHEFLDYDAEPFEKHISPRSLDLVLDPLGGSVLARSLPLLRQGGSVVSTVDEPDPRDLRRHRVSSARMVVRPDPGQLKEILELVREGRVRAFVSMVLPLNEARLAHEFEQAASTRGKILLVPQHATD